MSLLSAAIEWVRPRKQTVSLSQSQRASNRQRWEKHSAQPTITRRTVSIEKITRENNNMVSLAISPDDQQALDFKAGQFLTCYFAIPTESDGNKTKTIRRAYSLSSAPGSSSYTLSIKKLPKGETSQFIHKELSIGDHFDISGPSGDFVLQDNAKESIFIAAGSGITPIKSQIESLLESEFTHTITLIYANRNQRSIAFNKRFKALEKQHTNLKVIHVLSRPYSGWKGHNGRIDKECLSTLLKHTDIANSHFYICGPTGLIDTVEILLAELKIPATNICKERFIPAAKNTLEHPKEAQQIKFLRSGQTITAQPGETILEAGLRAGVSLEHSCQVGGCGHCKITIHSGEVVTDEPNCLSKEETAQGLRLACLSYACNTVEITDR